ncbi:hypothetical protein VPHD479_0359 [Vibrio phage D479]
MRETGTSRFDSLLPLFLSINRGNNHGIPNSR